MHHQLACASATIGRARRLLQRGATRSTLTTALAALGVPCGRNIAPTGAQVGVWRVHTLEVVAGQLVANHGVGTHVGVFGARRIVANAASVGVASLVGGARKTVVGARRVGRFVGDGAFASLQVTHAIDAVLVADANDGAQVLHFALVKQRAPSGSLGDAIASRHLANVGRHREHFGAKVDTLFFEIDESIRTGVTRAVNARGNEAGKWVSTNGAIVSLDAWATSGHAVGDAGARVGRAEVGRACDTLLCVLAALVLRAQTSAFGASQRRVQIEILDIGITQTDARSILAILLHESLDGWARCRFALAKEAVLYTLRTEGIQRQAIDPSLKIRRKSEARPPLGRCGALSVLRRAFGEDRLAARFGSRCACTTKDVLRLHSLRADENQRDDNDDAHSNGTNHRLFVCLSATEKNNFNVYSAQSMSQLL